MSYRGALTRGGAALAGMTVLVAPAMLLTLASCSGSSPAPAVRSAVVTRGDVTAGVAANGSFAAVSSENLGFATGGRLTSVTVKVGDRVQGGDLLATLDSRAAKHALEQAEANLEAQQAGLDRLTAATTVAGAQSSVDQARNVLSATKGQVAATKEADQAAIDRAQAQLSSDRDARDQAESAAARLKDSCRAAASGAAASAASSALLQQAEQQLAAGDTAGAAQTLQRLNGQLGAGVGTGDAAACTQVLTAESAVSAAKQKVVADKTVLVSAQQKKKVDAASGKLAVENAEQAVVTAQNGLNASTADRPHGIDAQQALVAAAQAAVATARKGVDDTRLVAPGDGTITAINGSRGEYVTASTGTTAQAPGSRAAIPGSGAPAAATGATRPGGTQFMVLSGVDKVQLVLPFEQSDAAQIKPAQHVTVQADALPGSELAGTVISVAPSSTVTAGAISYLVTVGLDTTTSGLADGQTARATVITQHRANVLTVPNAAVHQQGSTSTVVLLNDDASTQTVPVEVGVVGDSKTEVRSGVSEGQRVVLPGGAS